MTEIFNLLTICRCCHSDGSFKSLQLSYVYDNHIEVYSTMLKETFDVTINPPPFEASYAICDCCIKKLRDASYFKQQVLECEQKFEEYCKNEQALSISVKVEEVDYDSSNDADLGREAVNTDVYDHEDNDADLGKETVKTDVYDHEDEEYRKCKDGKKCSEISENTIKVVGNLNVVPSKCNQQIPIENAKPDRAISELLEKNLDVHTRTKQFQCDICQKKFSIKPILKKHIMWHFGANKKCICEICGLGFNDTTNLNIHIRGVHQKLRPFKCQLCPKTFTTNYYLKEHSCTHTGEKPFICELCNDRFAGRWKLQQHKLRYHPQSAGGQKEQEREKQIAHRRKYRFHGKCHLCSKDFTCRYSLNRHIITHSGIKPYACDQCDLKFTQASSVTLHKRKIHDPKPARVVQKVKCDLCNKSFKDINKHMVSHKSRPHVCEICLKSYPERNTLNRHILAVHQGVRYPCTLCDKKYSKLDSLQKHTRKIHKLESKKKVEEP